MSHQLAATWPSHAAPTKVKLPDGTRVYVVTDQELIGKKDRVHEGQVVPAHVWRDVVADGRITIKAGTPVLVRVDKIKRAKVAGIKGSMTLGAYETKAVDGQAVQLSGGYMKEGKGRIALAASLAGLVFLPLIFIKGKAAELPRGTIFDAYVGLDTVVEVAQETQPRLVDLSGIGSDISVEVLYDKLEQQQKPKEFEFRIQVPAEVPAEFTIDRINGQPVEPIPLGILSREEREGQQVVHASVGIKTLAKQFQKGINRFDVACKGKDGRLATEVVLNIQF